MHLPIYSPLCFVAVLEIFSAFCMRCCCTLCKLELAVQGVTIGMNLRFLREVAFQVGFSHSSMVAVLSSPACCHCADLLCPNSPLALRSCPSPQSCSNFCLCYWSGILSQKMKRSHPFESVHHLLSMTQIGICPLQRNSPIYHSLPRSRVLHEQMQIICKLTFCLSKSMK